MVGNDASAHDQQILAAKNDAARVNFGTHGIIEITGNDALDLLHRLSTNDVLHLAVCECRGTVLTTDKGRIVDYVYLAKTQHKLLMLSSQGREQSVVDWIAKYTIMEDVQLNIVTSSTNQISIIGPNAAAYINAALNLSLLPWGCTECTLPDGTEASVLCTKVFDTTSIHIIVQNDSQIVIEELASVAAMADDSYETFRIMQGMPLAGHELREEFNPFETGLASAISFSKGCYIGQEVIARLDTYQKVQKRLVALALSSIPKLISMVPLLHSGNEVGWITSVAPLAYGGNQFGLGVIRKDIDIGDNVTYVESGGTFYATVTDVPILTTSDNL